MKPTRWSSRCVPNQHHTIFIHSSTLFQHHWRQPRGGFQKIPKKEKRNKKRNSESSSSFSSSYIVVFPGYRVIDRICFLVGPPKHTCIGSDVRPDGRQPDWLSAPLRQIPAAPNSQSVTLRVHRQGRNQSESKQASRAKMLAIRVLSETTERKSGE